MIWYKEFKYMCYDIYFKKNNRTGISSMLSNSPEIIMSSLLTQTEHISGENYAWMGQSHEYVYKRKRSLYEHMGFQLEHKPFKFTGFEKVILYYYDKYKKADDGILDAFNSKFRWFLEHNITVPQQVFVNCSDLLNAQRQVYEELLHEQILR